MFCLNHLLFPLEKLESLSISKNSSEFLRFFYFVYSVERFGPNIVNFNIYLRTATAKFSERYSKKGM